jgi:hypothetical protein
MKTKSSHVCGLAVVVSICLVTSPVVSAEPQSDTQRAGEVSRVIPAVSIARGAKNITASPKSTVNWKDLVNTQVNGRARIALDDGSVLNVGSESSMVIAKHDAGAQQTELELTYGKLRTQAQKIAKPDGKFEVKTPAGVAGVVGTDFYMAFDTSTNTMNVVVFEGVVKVCNLAGVCVMVKAGQTTAVRSGDNSAPTPPTQAALSSLVAATKETEIGGPSPVVAGLGQAHHISKGLIFGAVAAAVIPGIVVPVVVTQGNKTAPPVKNPCTPGTSNPNCG